ncbi:caspase family protein [Streptomyces sp. CA-135486]|uniref:caspase family protein n=1 Tax=Streptomyces sp. CA-135486 TaxID=3240049 RepID=UPI003D9182EE
MQPLPDPSKLPERVLLAAGTETYRASHLFQTLTKVPTALKTVVEALEERGVAAVSHAPGYCIDPGREELCKAVQQAARAANVVIVYYTGHGLQPERGSYYLVLRDYLPGALTRSTLMATDLCELLTRRDEGEGLEAAQPTVLLILDCCFAGAGGIEVIRAAVQGIGNPNTWVMVSSGPLEYAQEGVFAKEFAKALRKPPTGTTSAPPYIHPDIIAQAINNAHASEGQRVRVFAPAAGVEEPPPFFPILDPGIPGVTVAEQHWLSRLRGTPQESTNGFYLTGRTGRIRAAEDLAKWMTGPQRGGLAVVTGSPGTGKSALLSLTVYLSRGPDRERLLASAGPDRLITLTATLLQTDTSLVSVHARGLTTDQVARAIAAGLGRDADTASGLLENLESNPIDVGRVVVVDAVDEANSVATLLGSLLLPLTRRHDLKVLVGVRSHGLTHIGEADLTIDLDTEPYLDPDALVDYIRQLLLASREGITTPYQPARHAADGRPDDVAAAVAEAIAHQATASTGRGRVAESFLIGQLLARAVRERAEVVDVTNDWQSQLPASVGDAFDEDLTRLTGNKTPLAHALLEALAWANGPGLPWENLWVSVAQALADQGEEGPGEGRPISDADVRWLLDKAGAYIVEDLGPGGRSVFRPFHDLIAAHLRGQPSVEQNNADPVSGDAWQQRRARTQQAITHALLRTVPSDAPGRRNWLAAHPYLRTYLGQHAAAASLDALSLLVHDLDFLAVADPATLTPLLTPTAPHLRNRARLYRRVRPLLSEDARANAAYLEEATLVVTGAPVPEGSTGILPLYHTRMAKAFRDDSLLTFKGHNGWVVSVAITATPDGRLLLAAGDEGGTVQLWDPATGAAVGEPLTGHRGDVQVAFTATLDGQLLLAAGDEGGTVQLWDPATGAAVGEPLTGYPGQVRRVVWIPTPEGRRLLALSEFENTVQVWDPVTGAAVGAPLPGHQGPIFAVALGSTPAGRLLIATCALLGPVRVWDPAIGIVVSEPAAGEHSSVHALAFGTTPDGRCLLATGDSEGTVRVWDPVSAAAVSDPLIGNTGHVYSLAFGTSPEGRLLLASGDHYGTVLIRDPLTGAPASTPLHGSTRSVLSLAFGTSREGQLLLASGGRDEMTRLWWPASDAEVSEPMTEYQAPVLAVTFGVSLEGRLLLACGDEAGLVRVWDPVSDTLVGEPLVVHDDAVDSMAFGNTPEGQLVLASGGRDGTVAVWDPIGGSPIIEPVYAHHRSSVGSLAFGTSAEGRLLLASGDHSDVVRVWDEATGSAVGKPGRLPSGYVSMALGASPEGRLLLVGGNYAGTVRAWDLGSGAPICEPLYGHDDIVSSLAFGVSPEGRLLVSYGSRDGTIGVWDLISGTLIGQPLQGHTGAVDAMAFGRTPHGELLLASGSDDATVRLWGPTSATCLATLRRRSKVLSLAFAGPMLAIGDGEGFSVIEFQG